MAWRDTPTTRWGEGVGCAKGIPIGNWPLGVGRLAFGGKVGRARGVGSTGKAGLGTTRFSPARKMCGSTTMMNSLRDWVSYWLRKMRPMSGRSPKMGSLFSVRVVLSWMRPPITSVWLSCSCTVVTTSREEICGTPLLMPAKLLTLGCKVTETSSPLLTTGVMSSKTPVWKLWTLVCVTMLNEKVELRGDGDSGASKGLDA